MKEGNVHNLFHMIIKMVSWKVFTEDIMVKVALIQENLLEKMITDEVLLILYFGVLTLTIESRVLIHICEIMQVNQLKIMISTMYNTCTYSKRGHTR